jgi:hypothetical protein
MVGDPGRGGQRRATTKGEFGMRTLFAAAVLAAALAGPVVLAQEAEVEDGSPEGDVGGAVGLATGAAADTFFIRQPLEYHLLATELPGRAVFLDATDTGLQQRTAGEPEAAAAADAAILQGEAPVGEITDLLIDRRGGTAGLVVELAPEMRGGSREIAVAMGLVRMLPDPEDRATTHILLSIDPVDLENAPTFERAELPQGGAEGAEAQPAGPSDEAEEGQ